MKNSISTIKCTLQITNHHYSYLPITARSLLLLPQHLLLAGQDWWVLHLYLNFATFLLTVFWNKLMWKYEHLWVLISCSLLLLNSCISANTVHTYTYIYLILKWYWLLCPLFTSYPSACNIRQCHINTWTDWTWIQSPWQSRSPATPKIPWFCVKNL